MSRKPPTRPAGAPPPDLGALSKPKANTGGGPALPGGGKRPPGPPPGLPPSMREAGITETTEKNKKPPPSGDVPQDIKDRGSRTVQPRPPPKGRPPPAGA